MTAKGRYCRGGWEWNNIYLCFTGGDVRVTLEKRKHVFNFAIFRRQPLYVLQVLSTVQYYSTVSYILLLVHQQLLLQYGTNY